MHPLGQLIREVFEDIVGARQQFSFLDFPNYSNVGDSAIWLGEVDYFRSRKAQVKYSADYHTYDPAVLNSFHPRGPILLTGGGNFGDLWYHHQRLREGVLREFPNRKIIQLPQSIHFQDRKNMEACKRNIASHRDFILIVRDTNCLEFAQRHFDCKIILCPDMAFAMKLSRLPIKTSPEPSVRAVYLSRSDKESVNKNSQKDMPGLLIVDWITENLPKASKFYQLTRRIERRLGRYGRFLPIQPLRFWTAERMAQERLERGCKLICLSKKLVTDRLHGMILGCLLGREVYTFDNSYGKLSSFYQTWGEYLPQVKFFDDERSALEAALS